LEYDDVMNKQREVVYGFRNEIIHSPDVRDRLMEVMEEVVAQKVDEHTSEKEHMEDWNVRALADWVNLNFPLGMPEQEITKAGEAGHEPPAQGSIFEGLTPAQYSVCRFIIDSVEKAYKLKVSFEEADALKSIERYTILSAIDKLWQEHLYNMDSLRNSIGLRAYGQRDPLIEYKVEAKKMFDDMMVNIKTEICHNIFRSASSLGAFQRFLQNMPQRTVHVSTSAFGGSTTTATATPAGGAPAQRSTDVVDEAMEAVTKAKPVRMGPKVGRNEPCPCGSGKKYKQCCGRLG
jgi:preprotein translocase subunit SecA